MTTLLQDQTKAANQGKPGYDVLGNPLGTATTSSVGDAQVLANQQAAAKLGIAIPGVGGSKQTQSTTTLSSDKSADIAKIQNTTNNLSQTGVTTDPTTGVSVHADGTVYTPGATNEPVEAPANGVSAGGYVGETYYPAGAPLPQDAAGSYMPTTAYSPTDLSILNNLNNQRSQNDSLTSSIIASIQNQYTQLIEQQKQTNAGQNAGETKLLLRNGGLQHTGSGTNVLAATVSYGISQLADLNNKEQMAILQAQQAGQQADFQLQDRINQEISDIRDKKVSAAVELNDKIAAANKAVADQKYQEKQDTQKAIQSIALSALQNGASQDTINAINSSADVESAMAAAGGSLQTATGQLGDYLQYKRDAETKGLVPQDYSTWKAADDAAQSKLKSSQAYSAAYATAAGKAKAESDAGTLNGGNDTVTGLAQQLVSGNLAPSELSKRAAGTASYNAVLKSADDYSMATTGKHFNIAQADRDYKFANQPATQNTLNYLKSLVGTADQDGNLVGGNLEELRTISDSVDRTKFPALNDAKAWAKLATGNVEIAQYQAVATEVADQVAKILQGGSGGGGTSDAKLQQAANLFNSGFSKDQLNGVIDSLKPLLQNRAKSMVGDNAYLSDYATDLGIDTGIVTPAKQVDVWVAAHPDKAETIAKAYEVPGATDQDVLDYIKLLK